MKIIVDTCSAIFIANGEVCDKILDLPDSEFYLGELVVRECGPLAREIVKRASRGSLTLLENSVSATEFARAVGKYKLGVGEVECILQAARHQLIVCTDDKKARIVAEAVLGADRVLGVLSLLQRCIDAKLLTVEAAWSAYELMRSRGAFLPDLPKDHFR